MLYTAILVLKVIYLIGRRNALSDPWILIYKDYIYRTSGVSKVNVVHGKTNVKIDLHFRETLSA
jgi:hypothetical protein